MLLESQNKKIIVIGSYNSGALSAVYALNKQGFEPILIVPKLNQQQKIVKNFYSVEINEHNLEKIIKATKPDAIMAIYGGQKAINACINLEKSGLFAEMKIKILGTDLKSLGQMLDRGHFSELLSSTNIPTPTSKTIANVEEGLNFANEYGYPVIVRASATTTNPGGDLCNNKKKLISKIKRAFKESPINNCLIEASVTGYKELEFEVVRDGYDNCILIGAFENIDAVGIHSADSMVVSPVQTLDSREFQQLRTVALRLTKMFNIIGSCTIRFAFDSLRDDYYVLEMNPSYNRSSVLISAITAYPIADIITKISLGIRLDMIRRKGFDYLTAASEPIMDYLIVKVPNWIGESKRLGTRRQAQGQIVTFGRSLESALMKAIESMTNDANASMLTQFSKVDDATLEENLVHPQANRLFFISEAFRRGYSIDEISELTRIDAQFLYMIGKLIDFITKIKEEGPSEENLQQAKRLGISDKFLVNLWLISAEELERMRVEYDVFPTYKVIDTVAGVIDTKAPYFYTGYEDEDELDKRLDMILIDGIENVSSKNFSNNIQLLKIANLNKEVGIISNSPDTLAFSLVLPITVFFEPLSPEAIAGIIDRCQVQTIGFKRSIELTKLVKTELKNKHVECLEWKELVDKNEV